LRGKVAYYVFVDRSQANTAQWLEWRKQFHKSKAEPQFSTAKAGLDQASRNGFPVDAELRFVEVGGNLALKKPEEILTGDLKFKPVYDIKRARPSIDENPEAAARFRMLHPGPGVGSDLSACGARYRPSHTGHPTLIPQNHHPFETAVMAEKKDGLTRRDFMKTVGLGGLAATGSIRPGSHSLRPGAEKATSIPRRKLGKTGAEISILALGGMFDTLNNQLMLRQAYNWA